MNDSGFTGLEAAIVLIAFVVVAAVFSYVVLGAGFFATQKTQETVYKGLEQATSNLQVVGNLYGMNTTHDAGEKVIDEIKFTLGLAPGAPSMDISKMTIIFSSQNTDPKTIVASPSVGVLKPGEQMDLTLTGFDVLPKGTKFTIELRPASGAALSITKTTPANIEGTNILY